MLSIHHIKWKYHDFKLNLVLISTLNSSKTSKLHEPVGQVQVLVFKKFTSAYLHQIAQ